MSLHQIPQNTCDAYRRISAGDNANHQRKGEFLNCSHTKDVENCDHNEGCEGSIDTSRQCLCNTCIYYVLDCGILHTGQVLTDTVEDNDRCIDRISDDRQHAGDKRISDGDPHDRVARKYYQNVVHQRDNRTSCKADIFKTEPDVDQNTDRCYDYGNNRIFSHLVADR